METIDGAMCVDPFFDEAQAFVKKVAATIPLTSAILDDWNSGYLDTKKVKGARIIYGGECVENCRSQCEICPLFLFVGVDSNQKQDFRTTLCSATKEYLDILPSKQRYLNCKTSEQYQVAYIEYIYQECDSRESLAAELDWIKGFRILYFNGVYDQETLMQKEEEIKMCIVRAVLDRMESSCDPRREFVFQYAKNIGLI